MPKELGVKGPQGDTLNKVLNNINVQTKKDEKLPRKLNFSNLIAAIRGNR